MSSPPSPPQPSPAAPPILSTSSTHIFEDPTPLTTQSSAHTPRYTDHELLAIYEIERTAREIQAGGWRRIALQFPDEMLKDATRVVEELEKELREMKLSGKRNGDGRQEEEEIFTKRENSAKKETPWKGDTAANSYPPDLASNTHRANSPDTKSSARHRLYILADTSYGACCVDEIAAEHVAAEVVVHYGRSCLSPVARLPVIYVFTSRPLDIQDVVAAFERTYADRKEKVVLVADITYHSHINEVGERLRRKGFEIVVYPDVVHDPESLIPNRDLKDEISAEDLKTYSLFHISEPLPALLLTLASRVQDMHIYPTTTTTSSPTQTLKSNTALSLRRRYALLTSLSTCSIFGILVNTLSVAHYLTTVNTIKDMIARAGKKSYTFVVGKVNAAKVANFAEIGGWVVVGCWESSLIESAEFWRPLITPFELGLALMGDGERVWSGEWRGGSDGVEGAKGKDEIDIGMKDVSSDEENDDEESAPPEFDLRTGRYISHTRPMHRTTPRRRPLDLSSSSPSSSSLPPDPLESSTTTPPASHTLARRPKGDLVAVTVNGVASPGAEYLRSKRTWMGLGSDFVEVDGDGEVERDGALMEEGRSGVARGYTVGERGEKT